MYHQNRLIFLSQSVLTIMMTYSILMVIIFFLLVFLKGLNNYILQVDESRRNAMGIEDDEGYYVDGKYAFFGFFFF